MMLRRIGGRGGIHSKPSQAKTTGLRSRRVIGLVQGERMNGGNLPWKHSLLQNLMKNIFEDVSDNFMFGVLVQI